VSTRTAVHMLRFASDRPPELSKLLPERSVQQVPQPNAGALQPIADERDVPFEIRRRIDHHHLLVLAPREGPIPLLIDALGAHRTQYCIDLRRVTWKDSFAQPAIGTATHAARSLSGRPSSRSCAIVCGSVPSFFSMMQVYPRSHGDWAHTRSRGWNCLRDRPRGHTEADECPRSSGRDT